MSVVINGFTVRRVLHNGQDVRRWVHNDETVYTSEIEIFDGSKLAQGYTPEYSRANTTTAGLWWAKPRYTAAGGWQESAWTVVPIDLTYIDEISVSWSYSIDSYAIVSIGIADKKPTANPVRCAYSCAFMSTENNSRSGSSTTKFDVSTARGVWYIVCHVRNTQGNVTDAAITKVVTGEADTRIVIIAQPQDVPGAIGSTVQLHVGALHVAAYQWQYKTAEGTRWTDLTWTGATTDTMTVTVNASRKTYTYRCALTDANGGITYTSECHII